MDNNINNPALQGSTNGPAKKKWQKPDLYLLDSDRIEATKTNNFVQEHTLKASIVWTGLNSVRFNAAGSKRIIKGDTANYLS